MSYKISLVLPFFNFFHGYKPLQSSFGNLLHTPCLLSNYYLLSLIIDYSACFSI